MLRHLDRRTPLLTNPVSTATLSATSRLESPAQAGLFFAGERSGRERDDVRLQGLTRHAFKGAQVRVGFRRMRLDANESGGAATFGAGRADLGRALHDVNLKCVHASNVHLP